MASYVSWSKEHSWLDRWIEERNFGQVVPSPYASMCWYGHVCPCWCSEDVAASSHINWSMKCEWKRQSEFAAWSIFLYEMDLFLHLSSYLALGQNSLVLPTLFWCGMRLYISGLSPYIVESGTSPCMHRIWFQLSKKLRFWTFWWYI